MEIRQKPCLSWKSRNTWILEIKWRESPEETNRLMEGLQPNKTEWFFCGWIIKKCSKIVFFLLHKISFKIFWEGWPRSLIGQWIKENCLLWSCLHISTQTMRIPLFLVMNATQTFPELGAVCEGWSLTLRIHLDDAHCTGLGLKGYDEMMFRSKPKETNLMMHVSYT